MLNLKNWIVYIVAIYNINNIIVTIWYEKMVFIIP